ncbi:hypothetical protein PMZ80_003568 [Knufia obscura]|uniref:DnaJ homologue subfamily C member 28 conserved domain-containing protein n=1 Tax=Knufia obscura TaxID=1635080 RepID=A0ABR0RV41_9EURO|nr:hypothetical protein PMZ80_003568 [Knufia obscura]
MVRSQTASAIWTCQSCLRAQARRQAQRRQWRAFSAATRVQEQQSDDKQPRSPVKEDSKNEEQGAMSKRLSEMAEETLDTGSKSDRKLISDAGFSDDLKRQLEERIAQTAFRAENQQAMSIANMPTSAGKGTRDQAAAPIWTGNESIGDAALRMLDDSHKRLRMPARKPTLGPANLKPRPKQKLSVADRLANARDRTSIYAQQQENMSEEERERFRKELKDKFQPGARPMPTTLQGLTSLANERIEDAIARGQFRNINRGKGVNIERDYTASSPFLDTTEYFMNKIIQKQEIVPPWIEKQQELMKSVNSFRQRLRSDWRRHAARSISSKGGSLEEQIRRAKAFALAEEKHTPRPATRSESMSAIDPTGMLTSITIEERIAAGVAPDPVEDPIEIKVIEATPAEGTEGMQASAEAGEKLAEDSIVISTTTSDPTADATETSTTTVDPSVANPDQEADAQTPPTPSPRSSSDRVVPMAYPFRDPDWERSENAYHNLAIKEINNLARSYNLMAPKLAQKPYYNLPRELTRCYADVAPTLPDEILQRARKGPVRVSVAMHKEGGIMEKFQGTGHIAKVRDEPGERGYGFKQFWRDLFSKDEEPKRRRAV